MEWKKVRNAYTAEAKGRTFKIKLKKGMFTCSVEDITFCKRPSLEEAREECDTMVKLWGESPPVITEGNEYVATYRTKKTRQCRKGVMVPVEYLNETIYAPTLRKAKAAATSQAPEGYILYEVRTPPTPKDRIHTYYGVVMNVYPSGGYDVGIRTWDADHIPEDTHYTRTTGEIVTTWFETEEDAKSFYN